MCHGVLPAFAPTGESELHAPTKFLMEVYESVYCLKNYIPTLLAPVHYGRTFLYNPVYYSFQNPTLLYSVQKTKTSSSVVDDMRNFKSLMEFSMEKSFSALRWIIDLIST
ncbi:MAG: hypothetical protein K0Q74_133 [Gammaproteobacteria bacterium]|jgi:hypothetical protein|nr:hypothetical protein [Gammaproteobacteria bacterium]